MYIFLAILVFFITISVDLITDIDKWRNNQPVNHKRGALLRLIGLIPVCVLLGWASIPLVGFTYWTLFDGLYNHFRGFNWWFTGSEDKDDAQTDNLLQSLSLREHISVKLGGTAYSILLLIVMVK